MPQEVQETIEGILQILDSEYGAKKSDRIENITVINLCNSK
jgi:hypothetical protein